MDNISNVASNMINNYHIGDNLVLLEQIQPNSIDLCYIDPPFCTGRDFNHFNDKWDNLPAFVDFIKLRIEKIYSSLKTTGTLVVHVDTYASHYLKVMLDSVFGVTNFRNEIVWVTTGNKQSKQKLQRSHDVLLVYSKSKDYTFNPIHLPYNEVYRRSNNIKKDKRGEYVTSAAHNSQPEVIKRDNLKYNWNGHNMQWWWSKDRMQSLHNEDRLQYNKRGIPRAKKYLHEMKGIPIRDVWTDIQSMQKSEKINYATQKPVKLLERIVKMYSNENDLVLDCFAGSGTTGRACVILKRNFILMDKNENGKIMFLLSLLPLQISE